MEFRSRSYSWKLKLFREVEVIILVYYSIWVGECCQGQAQSTALGHVHSGRCVMEVRISKGANACEIYGDT